MPSTALCSVLKVLGEELLRAFPLLGNSDYAQVSCSSQHDCLGNKQKSVFSVMLKKFLVKSTSAAGVCLFQHSGRSQSWLKVRAPALGLTSVPDQSCSATRFGGFKISQHPKGMSSLKGYGNCFLRILVSGYLPLAHQFCLSGNTALS